MGSFGSSLLVPSVVFHDLKPKEIPMPDTVPAFPALENSILAALPQEDYERIAPSLTSVTLELGDVLYQPHEPIRHVYFPLTLVASLITILEDGGTVEAGIIGYPGMVGIPVVLGAESSPGRAIIQHSGDALMMTAEALKAELSRNGQLQQLLLRFTHTLFTQVSQTAACNRLHTVEERLARWLLMIHNCVEEDEFLMTQEFIATMLGVRRAGVTVAAGALQSAGLIKYKRGCIHILTREGLEDASCECYKMAETALRCGQPSNNRV
jgi:CRP-like cAMP-binding protein